MPNLPSLVLWLLDFYTFWCNYGKMNGSSLLILPNLSPRLPLWVHWYDIQKRPVLVWRWLLQLHLWQRILRLFRHGLLHVWLQAQTGCARTVLRCLSWWAEQCFSKCSNTVLYNLIVQKYWKIFYVCVTRCARTVLRCLSWWVHNVALNVVTLSCIILLFRNI